MVSSPGEIQEYASFNISDLGFYNLAASRVIMLRSGEIWSELLILNLFLAGFLAD